MRKEVVWYTCQHNGATTTRNQFNLVESSCYGVLGVVVQVRMVMYENVNEKKDLTVVGTQPSPCALTWR